MAVSKFPAGAAYVALATASPETVIGSKFCSAFTQSRNPIRAFCCSIAAYPAAVHTNLDHFSEDLEDDQPLVFDSMEPLFGGQKHQIACRYLNGYRPYFGYYEDCYT